MRNDLHILPQSAAFSLPRVVLHGDQEVLVENHRGLYSYDDTRIRIRTSRGVLSISGEKMTIAHFGAEDLLIRGKVRAVTLEAQS